MGSLELTGMAIVAVVLLLKTIANGGDWFDFLNADVTFNNRYTNFEFNGFFVLLCVMFFGGAACLLMMAMRPEISSNPSPQAVAAVASAPSGHKKPAPTVKVHKKLAQ